MRVLFIGGTGNIGLAVTQLAAALGVELDAAAARPARGRPA